MSLPKSLDKGGLSIIPAFPPSDWFGTDVLTKLIPWAFLVLGSDLDCGYPRETEHCIGGLAGLSCTVIVEGKT